MKTPFRNDLVMKIVSVLIAIGLWLYVVQVQSPDIERTVKGIPVVFTQKSTLESRGLILLGDKEHTIDLKIRGKRKYVADVTPENTTVVADVSTIETTGTHTVYTNVVLPYGNLEVLTQHPASLSVDVDYLITVEREITVNAKGEPKSSYTVGELRAEPEKVQLKGPKSILDGVASVTAEVDVSGKDADIVETLPLKIYGSNEKEIKSAYITPDFAEAEVRCQILKTKEVDIVPVFAEHTRFQPQNPEAQSEKVTIMGTKAAIDAVSSVKTQPISPSEIGENGEVTVALDLPNGVKVTESEPIRIRLLPKASPSAQP